MQDRLLKLAQRSRELPLLLNVAGAAALTTGALAAQAGVNAYASDHRFLLFFAANAANAFLWRSSVAVVFVLVGGLLASHFFVEPIGSPLPATAGDAIALALYLALGCIGVLVVSALLEAVARMRTAMLAARKAEAANEALLIESNHRIKNNLQLMASLLTFEAEESGQGSDPLSTASRRLYAISRVHDQLSGGLDQRVEASVFVERLCADLANSLGCEPRIRIVPEVEDVSLPARTATLVGLLANELVTNAVKYAFPGDRPGAVHVQLRRRPQGLRLRVADDGRGLAGTAPGTGQRLIRLLAADLGGELQIENCAGSAFTVDFPAPRGSVNGSAA